MRIRHISSFTGGWFIGDFEPAIYKTDQFEVCYKFHHKDEKWPIHYHKIATEVNYLIHGKMTIHGKVLEEGDIFTFDPGEVADPVFLTDCELIVVKFPSVPGDKYEV